MAKTTKSEAYVQAVRERLAAKIKLAIREVREALALNNLKEV
jgi:hypothetical protein